MMTTDDSKSAIDSKLSASNRNGRCRYYVSRKKRVCRLMAASGKQFCGEHLIFEDHTIEAMNQEFENSSSYPNSLKSNKLGARLWCPLDPKHTVDEHDLERHLRRCNARPKPKAEYIVNDLHVKDPMVGNFTDFIKFPSLKEVPTQMMAQLIHFLNSHTIPLSPHSDFPIETSFKKYPGDLDKKQGKHAIQCDSLLRYLFEVKIIQKDSVLIEVGAGKGLLARHIHEAFDRKGPDAIILIDRSNVRKKADSFIKSSKEVELERCLVDIKDLDLGKLKTLKRHSHKPIIIVGKHVCGSATDLTLRCVVHALKEGLPIRAILIALCCHHRCDWISYCHQSWMQDHEIDGTRFQLMRFMSTWAISGFKTSKNSEANRDWHEDTKIHAEEPSERASCETHYSGLDYHERMCLGKICKRIIDQGRLKYLSSNGFNVKLIRYVDHEVSPENTALLAWRGDYHKQ